MESELFDKMLVYLPHLFMENGKATSVSPVFTELTGYPEDEVLQKTISHVFYELLNINFKLFEVQYDKIKEDIFLYTRSGKVRRVNIILHHYINTDRQVCILIEKSNTRLENGIPVIEKLLSENYLSIGIYSAPDLTLLNANQSYLDLLDKPFNKKEVSLGLKLDDIVPSEIVGRAKEVWMNVINTGEIFYGKEIKGIIGNSKNTYCNNTVVPVIENGQVRIIVSIVEDVTEKVLAQKKNETQARIIEQQKNQLEAVIESMEESVILVDLGAGKLKINRAAAQLLGYGNSQDCPDDLAILYQDDYQLCNLDDTFIPFEERPIHRVMRGEILRNFEVEFRQISTGKTRYLSYNGTLVKNSDGDPELIVLTIRDISEREKLIRELEQEQARLQAVLDQMPSGVAIVLAPSGKRILANKRYTEILQYNYVPKELRAETIMGEYFHCNGEPYLLDELPLVRSIRHGETVSNEDLIFRRMDGSLGSLLVSSSPVLDRDGKIAVGVAVFTDITEIKQAMTKAALANQLQQIIEFLPDGTFVVDKERKVIAWNRALEQLTGLPKQEIIGTVANADAFYDTGERTLIDIVFDGMENLADTTIEKNGDVLTKQVLIPSLNQRGNVCLDIKATPLRNEHGEISGVIETVIDVKHQKDILERITDGFYILDKEWRFIFINRQAKPFLNGRKKEELLGRVFWDVFPKLVRSVLYNQYHRAMSEMVPVDFEFKGVYQTLDWYQIHCYPAEDGLSVLMQDITERKLAEEANRRLAMLVENSEDAILTISPEGIITSWNKGATKTYGYTAGEIVGEHVRVLSSPELREQTQRFEFLNFGENADMNLLHVSKGGARIHVSAKISMVKDLQGNIIELFAIYRDVTERIKIEEALASERELLMVTLNSLGEGVVATDQDGRIMLINEAATILTGYSQQEATGKPFQQIFYILTGQTNGPDTKITFKTGVNQQVLVTRDLREVAVTINRSPIKAGDGQVIGAVIVFQDITQKQKIEHELLKTEKLESLGILAGGIAHDFNNILSAILANVQLAMVKLAKNEDINKYLLSTIETAHKASALTKQLLIFSKGGTPVAKDSSLIEMIKDTAKFILRGSKTKAEFAIPDDLWPAYVDEGQISQVIQNLVINAKQAMSAGGIVNINAENVTVEPGTHLHPGRYIKITVQDQGSGISKDNLRKIFDPFFTTKKEGNGLGLSISYSIIQQHGGFIEVESQEGVGTSFMVYLPASNAMLVRVETGPKKIVAGEGSRILLMDDEEAIRNTVGEMLESHNFKAVLAKDGAEAIELYKAAQSSAEPIDIVIMDLTVPGGMGGQEAIAILRGFDPQIKAVVSSGYANDPIMAGYQRFGFSGVVSKPYKFDELIEVINQVLENKEKCKSERM